LELFVAEIVVDLSKPHIFRDWRIVAQEKVKHSDGREYSKISYETSPSFVKKIVEVSLCVFLCSYFVIPHLTTAGLALLVCAVQQNQKQEVLSTKRLEDHFWDRIHQAPSTDELYQKAKRKQPKLHLLLLKKEDTNALSNGCADLHTGALESVIGRTEDEILSTIVFEMTNFAQKRRFDAIDAMKARDMTADEYAKETERVEYDGRKMHHKAISEAVSKNNWNPSMDRYKSDPDYYKDFDSYWNSIQNSPHANNYRTWHRKYYS
jgi:hypothetical protein